MLSWLHLKKSLPVWGNYDTQGADPPTIRTVSMCSLNTFIEHNSSSIVEGEILKIIPLWTVLYRK